MLVNNEVGTIQPLDEIAALVRGRAPHARAPHRRGAGGAVARRRRAPPRRRPRRDLGAQVRRSEGHRCARRPRRRRARAADRGRWSGARAAVRDRRTSPARWRWRPRCGPRAQRATPTSPRIAGLRDRLVDGLLATIPDAFENGDRGAEGRRQRPCRVPRASRPRRCSSRSTTRGSTRRPGRRARRAPPSRRTCSPRWGCPRADALASIRLSLGLRVDRRRRRHRARRRSRRGRAAPPRRRRGVSSARASGSWSR